MALIRTLLVLAGAALPLLATAHQREAVTPYLEALRAEHGFPGASVAFVLPDGSTFSVSVGVRAEGSDDRLLPSDLMLAGSIGKTVVSALILRAVQAGTMRLDQPVAWWLGAEPWFRDVPNAGRVTLRQLMNHTSGIPEHVRDVRFVKAVEADPDRVWGAPDWMEYVRGVDRLGPPGERFSYADTNYILAALAYEHALGRPMYADARALLGSFGIDGLVPSDRRRIPGLIPGHARPIPPFSQAGSTIVDGLCRLNPQMEYAGGGFASTALGLAGWAHALFGGRVLGSATAEAAGGWLDGVPANTGPGDRYGLGVQIRNSPLGVTYGHGGWFPGYLSEMAMFPESGIAAAIQFNTDDGRRIGKRPYQVLVELVQLVVEARRPGAGRGGTWRSEPTR